MNPAARTSTGGAAPAITRRRFAPRDDGPAVAFALPTEAIEAIAERAAEIVNARLEPEDGWLRGADHIAAYLDCPRSRVYALASAGRIPVHHDGSALIARKSELDRWIRDGGGLRP